ncbi:MAG: glycosyltransferase [Ruthenibacterium sp.]
MSDKNINTSEYWDNRFSKKSWEDNHGDEQSKFFSELMIEMMPQWLKTEIESNKYTICDMGCAIGGGTEILAKEFENSKVTGIDFSKTAVDKAKKNHTNCEFYAEDIFDFSRHFDIVTSSNTLEHLTDYKKAMDKLFENSEKYLVLLLPLDDKFGYEEHVNSFTFDSFPVVSNEFKLVYHTWVCSQEYENTCWLGYQIMLIYARNAVADVSCISDFCGDVLEKDNYVKLYSKYNELCNENKIASSEMQKVKEENIQIIRQNDELSAANLRHMQEKEQYEIAKEQHEILKEQNETAIKRISEKERETKQILSYAERNFHIFYGQAKIRQDKIEQAIEQCQLVMNSRLFKFIHLFNRIKVQLVLGNMAEKKKFIHWITHRSATVTDNDHRFQQVHGIQDILVDAKNQALTQPFKINTANIFNQQARSYTSELDIFNSKFVAHIQNTKAQFVELQNMPFTDNATRIESIIANTSYKGIILYPHTVHWKPLQTPQQLLRAFANEGWLCFFCEHPATFSGVKMLQPNLYMVNERDLVQGVGSTEVTILLTWMGSMSFVDSILCKKVWYHILDQIDIFDLYDSACEQMHNKMVKSADYVSFVAQALKKYTKTRIDAVYLPNACHPSEIAKVTDIIPSDLSPIIATGHKIIGYFGYIAQWMDMELLQTLAQTRQDYEIVLIGDCIANTQILKNLRNVHLLGLKNYEELPSYASHFDVAIIPFKICDMMDCVSPIKFYEYCAYGLPTVCSYMPEMDNYVCDFVANVHSTKEFIEKVDEFVSPDIKRNASENAPKIAHENSWASRTCTMEKVFYNADNSVYSNADYTNYDIIILSVIDYDFRFQRPQHFAASYARNGHRVFYINANHFNPSSVVEIENNLFVVNIYNSKDVAIHVTDWSDNIGDLKNEINNLLRNYSIKDAITIVDYPNWVLCAEYLRTMFGFKIVVDYMDDYTGFLNPAEKLVGENCTRLLKCCDVVIPSSAFLSDIATKYFAGEISIVRNGTEYKHFHQAYCEKTNNERPVIGYYGAIAHWFDADKICYLAGKLPDCDIVLIGEVTEYREKLERVSNIILLGEKPYSELPHYLAEFDVCLIPFDTSTDLIKATNPVKFYEYLSAGKKIVTTEIPELEPFKDEYLYMANDNDRFVEYVKLCINKEDTLRSPAECAEFAKANDWQNRYNEFRQLAEHAVPKISIVVLTYNSLEINKMCISSILNKTAYPNYQLIVVDNASTDGTVEYLKELDSKHISNVKVVLNTENLGFAAGNNVGMRLVDEGYTVLLNNDVLVTRGWLTGMVKHMENDSKLGMCGPVTNSIGNEAKIDVNYFSAQEMLSFADKYTFNNNGKMWENPTVLALFCTMIRSEVVEVCGYLDENYGVGMFEDDDYAFAVKSAGYHLAIAEDSFVHHFEGISFKKMEDKHFLEVFNSNKKKFENKWNVKWIMHEKRKGVTCDTNMENIIL